MKAFNFTRNERPNTKRQKFNKISEREKKQEIEDYSQENISTSTEDLVVSETLLSADSEVVSKDVESESVSVPEADTKVVIKPEASPVVVESKAENLTRLYMDTNVEALRKKNDSGEVVFKDRNEVLSDIRYLFINKQFKIGPRERSFLSGIGDYLLDIKNFEYRLNVNDLNEDVRVSLANNLESLRKKILSETVAFFQTEARNEESGDEEESSPEMDLTELASKADGALLAFGLYESIDTNSEFRKTPAFINAEYGAKTLEEFKNKLTREAGDDDSAPVLYKNFINQMSLLRSSAEERGGLKKLMEKVITPELKNASGIDKNEVGENNIETMDVITSSVGDAKSQTIPDQTLDAIKTKSNTTEATNLDKSKDEISSFKTSELTYAHYESLSKRLSEEFKSSNTAFTNLSNLIEQIKIAEGEDDDVEKKASLAKIFIKAIYDVEEKYKQWQDDNKVKSEAEAIAKQNDKEEDNLSPLVNDIDLDLDKPVSDPQPIFVQAPEVSLSNSPEATPLVVPDFKTFESALSDYQSLFKKLSDKFKLSNKGFEELTKTFERIKIAREGDDSKEENKLMEIFIKGFEDVEAEYEQWQEDERRNDLFRRLARARHKKDKDAEKNILAEAKDLGIDDFNDEYKKALVENNLKESELLSKRELARENFFEKETAFNDALKAYFEGKGFFSRLNSSKKVLGLDAHLPEELNEMRSEYRKARAEYAKELEARLQERKDRHQAKKQEGKSNEYNKDSAETAKAFTERFILDPQKRQLAMQEKSLLNLEQSAQLKKIMGSLSKHKWLIRGGSVVAVGLLAGLSGGAGVAFAGASWKAARMAASIFTGSLAANIVHDNLQVGVNKADKKLQANASIISGDKNMVDKLINAEAKDDQKNYLDEISKHYGDALLVKEKAVKFQRNATIGATVATGGLTGWGSGVLMNTFGSPDVVPTSKIISENKVTDKILSGVVEVKESNVINDKVFSSENTVLKPSNTLETIKTYTVEKDDTVNKILVKNFDNKLSNLSSIERGQVMANLFNKLKINLNVLEQELDKSLNVYRLSDNVNTPLTQTPVNIITETPQVNAEKIYAVQNGDTINKIINNNFNKELNGLTDLQKQYIISEIKKDPLLLHSLGIKGLDNNGIISGENVDLGLLRGIINREISELTTNPKAPLSFPKPSSAPATGQYLEHPDFKELKTKLFLNEEKFQTTVNKQILSFDNKNKDILDIFSDYKSPYNDLLKDMTFEDFHKFLKQSPSEIKQILIEKNIKFDSYLSWQAIIEKMEKQEILKHSESTKISDIFGQYIIFAQMTDHNHNIKIEAQINKK